MFPRVKDIVRAYDELGLDGVKEYFNNENLVIDPYTWSGHIKKSIDDGLSLSVCTEIEIILEKFKFYEHVSKESNRTGTGTIRGERNNETKGEVDR